MYLLAGRHFPVFRDGRKALAALRGTKNSPETAGRVVFNDKNVCWYIFREEQAFFYADRRILKLPGNLPE
jgi:hypothetical protein